MLTFNGRLIKPRLFWVHVCPYIPNFVFVYIDYDFPKCNLGILTSDSLILISASVGVSRWLSFMILAFPGYISLIGFHIKLAAIT